MQKVDVEKCIFQSFSLITLRLKIKAVYLLDREEIHTWMLSIFKTPSRQCSLTCGPSYVSRVVSSHLVYSGFSLRFILCLSLCLVVSHILYGQVG